VSAVRGLRAVVVLVLLGPAFAAAQTVDEIVSRHVAARGGREALAALRSVRMTGRALGSGGRQALVRREIARPGRIRTEFEFQGTTGVYTWDGSQGWRVSPLEGRFVPEALPADEATLAAEQADVEGPLVDWQAKGHRVELAGTEDLPGGKAHRLKVTLKNGVVRELWVDAATGFVVRAVSARRVRGHELAVEATFADYRETGGVAFARSIEAGVRGRPERLRIVVETVELNPALEDSRFRLTR
jgi:hypothetical protein